MSLAANLEPSILFLVPNLYWDLQDAVGAGILDQGVTAHAGVPGANTAAAAAARDYLGVSRQFPGGNADADVVKALWSSGTTMDQVIFLFFKYDTLDAVNARFLFYFGTWGSNGWGLYRGSNGHLTISGNPAPNLDTGFVVNDTDWHSLHQGFVGGVWGIVFDGVYKTFSGGAFAAPSQLFYLGGNPGYSTGAMQGRMAHMAFWANSGPSYADTNGVLGVSGAPTFLTAGGAAQQINQALSALNTVQTALNRIQPPIISNVGILSTHHLTGTGTLSLTGRGIEVIFDFVPVGWGFRAGLVNIFENRLCQLLFLNLLSDGATQVVTYIEEQYENTRVYLFDNNVPLSLGYDVTPGAGIVVRQLG